ncbi:uncharacterized protein CLUP02_17434 [Colletotrichum lupini]|uniref:Uncharacterized protein n=1 Tax=Colletotrichum lupini TaxID=145971 RepID=A0A9Q8SFB0_9PEZI|nr:uncharacterized protein CLUP02_17434 [Colletotrichum lupini]UQC75925.1 hypothetical protein CLUP02_17434 [Colletotrichum lupini]
MLTWSAHTRINPALSDDCENSSFNVTVSNYLHDEHGGLLATHAPHWIT